MGADPSAVDQKFHCACHWTAARRARRFDTVPERARARDGIVA